MFNNSLWAVIKMTFKQRMELSWLNLITADPWNIQKSNPWFIEHWEQQDQRTFYRKHMKVNSRIPNQWQNCSLGGYCIYSNVIDCSLVEDNKQQLCSVGRWEQDKTMGKCLLVCDNCIDYGWMHIVWVSGVVWCGSTWGLPCTMLTILSSGDPSCQGKEVGRDADFFFGNQIFMLAWI